MAKHPTKRVAREAVFSRPLTLPDGRSSFLSHPPASFSRDPRVGVGKEPFRSSGIPAERSLDLMGLLVDTRSHLLQLSVNFGLKALKVMLEQDRERLCGLKGFPDPAGQATRYGYDDGSVVLGGRRVGVRNARGPARAGEDLPQPTDRQFNNESPDAGHAL